MRKKVITTVVTFSTTTAAMKMEKTAKEAEFPGRLIPIPSEISAQCGLAWKCVEQSEEEAEVFLKEKQGKKKNSDREKEKDRNLKREWKRRKKLCIIHSQYCA